MDEVSSHCRSARRLSKRRCRESDCSALSSENLNRERHRTVLAKKCLTLNGRLEKRQYCEAEGIPLKAFGNWRVIFRAEPQPPERKLLYRRRGLSHTLSHSLSHPLVTP